MTGSQAAMQLMHALSLELNKTKELHEDNSNGSKLDFELS